MIAERQPEVVGPANVIMDAFAGALRQTGLSMGGGGETHIHFDINVQTIDATDFRSKIQDEIVPEIIETLEINRHGARTKFRNLVR